MADEMTPRESELAAMRALTDDQVAERVAHMVEHFAYPMEMQRRLVLALKEFKAASERASRASEQASQRLLAATWVLIGLTVAIVALTLVLVITA